MHHREPAPGEFLGLKISWGQQISFNFGGVCPRCFFPGAVVGIASARFVERFTLALVALEELMNKSTFSIG